MDYGWFMQWRDDAAHFAPLSVTERIAALSQPYQPQYYVAKVKKILPPGNTIRVYSGDTELLFNLRYYLLPVEVSDHGDYIMVYGDNIEFDPRYNILTRKNEVIADSIGLVAQMDQVYLYRARETHK
jgi:hypothetical protein